MINHRVMNMYTWPEVFKTGRLEYEDSIKGKLSALADGISAWGLLVPMTVGGHTPTRFTVEGITYKKSNGYSYPSGSGQCQPYDESKDETAKLEAYNTCTATVIGINEHLYSFGKLRVKRGTKNIHAILKQAEILAALIDEGQDGK